MGQTLEQLNTELVLREDTNSPIACESKYHPSGKDGHLGDAEFIVVAPCGHFYLCCRGRVHTYMEDFGKDIDVLCNECGWNYVSDLYTWTEIY